MKHTSHLQLASGPQVSDCSQGSLTKTQIEETSFEHHVTNN